MASFVAPLEHPRRRVDDALARHARHDQRDAPPVRGCPASVRCPVRQDHVTFALASLAIGLGAVVADKGLGVGLRQPVSFLATEAIRAFCPVPEPRWPVLLASIGNGNGITSGIGNQQIKRWDISGEGCCDVAHSAQLGRHKVFANLARKIHFASRRHDNTP